MGLLDKIKNGLTKTREQLITRIEWIVQGKPLDEDAFDEMEEALILADTGIETSQFLMERLKDRWKRGHIKTTQDIKTCMSEEIEKILKPAEAHLNVDAKKPFVILTLGVNGVGKTTTIAKMAKMFQESGKTILLGACDTFRAAAIEQLEVWAKRLNVDIIKHKEGSDPAAVAYDSVRASIARGIDVLILDTAGRLHTNTNLMEEMKKIKRIVNREIQDAPHETLLVVDATNGQNAIVQAKTFHEAIGVTGIVITKLDGTAKGGFILPIAHLLKLPIRYIGVGEKFDDLIPFTASYFSKAMLEGN
ncbi:MAG: signal recognition particle-docking protein FtsY [Syntrophorhabdaceae bacterium]|nr:signal recognition particle-docking protein FtsY [Syntrophorhabdaceae bacterium]